MVSTWGTDEGKSRRDQVIWAEMEKISSTVQKVKKSLLWRAIRFPPKPQKGFLTYHAKAGALCEPAAEWGRGAFMGDNNTVVRRQENYPGLTKYVRPGGKSFVN